MSFRTTAVLMIIFLALGGYVYYYGPTAEVKRVQRPPFVYEIDTSDIKHLDVTYQGKSVAMDLNPQSEAWEFAPDSVGQGKPDIGRVNGIRLLLSGPGAKRELVAQKAANLADYGLDQPAIVGNVTTKNDQKFRVLIGDRSPNGESNYVKLEGYDPIFLVDSSWGRELARFVTEPPIARDDAGS